MKKHAMFPAVLCCTAMVLLILDAKCALSSAREGVDLCISTVIPSLFPFFILSAFINASLLGTGSSFLRPLSKLCNIPHGAEPLLLVGLLGGYPVGAKNIQASYANGQLSKTDSMRMLSFCNNAGPAFIFGFLSPLFENKSILFLLWGIHVLSAVLTSLILPSVPSGICKTRPAKAPSVVSAMDSALKSTALVCGWVIVFRVIIGFLSRWFLWLLPKAAQVVISGILELTNGCVLLGEVSSPALRFVLAELFLSFGGLCVLMQTSAVCAPLPIGSYIKGKLIQTTISLLLSLAVLPAMFHIPATVAICGIVPVLIVISKKVVAFTGNMRYNKEKSLQ